MNHLMRTLWLVLLTSAFAIFAVRANAQDSSMRQWTDVTGRFKVNGRLIEVRDGDAYLENAAGKTIKIPIARLSRPDQVFLEAGDNPFEMVDENDEQEAAATQRSASGANRGLWISNRATDWSEANEVVTMAAVPWNPPMVDSSVAYSPKRAPLSKKMNFHENTHPLVVNAKIGRAVVGYTVSFAVPKPLSRLSLVDLKSGRSVHSDQEESYMRPLALLDDGNRVVMVGGNRDHDGETKDTLQLWRVVNRKVIRSASWIPYPDDETAFRRTVNGEVVAAGQVSDDLFYTLSEKGHLAVWEIDSRRLVWHARFAQHAFDIALSPDRNLIAVVDGSVVMLVRSVSGDIVGSTVIAEGTRVSWPKIRWSPDAQQLVIREGKQLHRLDAVSGDWIETTALPGSSSASADFDLPHPSFVLLDKKTLLHLPTKIDACTYSGIDSLEMLGRNAIVVVQDRDGGVVIPAELPSPGTKSALERAVSTPDSFAVYPGVPVSIDVSGVAKEYRKAVATHLENAATQSGFQVQQGASVAIVGTISEPYQDAINFPNYGSYIVTLYSSIVELRSGSTSLLVHRDTNISPSTMMNGGPSIEHKIEELGKQPNLEIFSSVRFPKFMQKPEGETTGQTALTKATFTLRGLVE